jgi:hypothetical protein
VTTQTIARSDVDVMDLLAQGVPLTLLMDLVDPWGPRSDELYVVEGSAA